MGPHFKNKGKMLKDKEKNLKTARKNNYQLTRTLKINNNNNKNLQRQWDDI